MVLTLTVAAYARPEAANTITKPVKKIADFDFIAFSNTDSPFKKPLVPSGFVIFAYSFLFINAGCNMTCAIQPSNSLFQA